MESNHLVIKEFTIHERALTTKTSLINHQVLDDD